jgi:hypothetical protein
MNTAWFRRSRQSLRPLVLIAFLPIANGTATDDLPFDPPPVAEPVPGIIAEWALSPAARVFDLAPERYLDGQPPAAIAWLPVKSEPSGLVDVARYRKPVAQAASRVWARTVIHVRQKETRPFCFGFRDDVSLYLNGRILFRGLNGDQRRDPSSPGVIGWNDTVYLPLEEGDNDLVLMVTGQSGGGGFMARDLDAIYRHPGLHEAWEIAGELSAPESVAYDAARQVLYVSNFAGGFISRVSLEGKLLTLKWVDGLKGPTGLKMSRDHLYAVERSGIAEIDPGTSGITRRYPIPGAAFPNDLAIDDRGTIYVTDTLRNCVYQLDSGVAEICVQGEMVGRPNGILVEKNRLLVGVTGDSAIRTVDLKTKQVATLLTLAPGANLDGLVSDGRGGYLFSDYFGRVYRADAAGRKTLLLDRMGPHQYTADFEYVPEKGLLIVPSLYDNRLTAYTYQPGAP